MSHLQNYITECLAHGISYADAIARPAAKHYAEMDDRAHAAKHAAGSKKDFLAAFDADRRANGGPAGFRDQEEMLLAMSDSNYHTSQAYREAVEEIMARTPAEVLGVSIDAKFADGSKMQMNQAPSTATVESMLDNARRDALREHVNSIDQSTAKGRYELMKFIAENPDAANAVYQDLTPDQFVTEAAMLADQQDGKRDEIVIPATQTDGGY